MSKKLHYECYRCEKIFDQMGGIKTHLKRKKPCEWKNKEMETSDEEVYQKSIEKKFHTITKEEVNTIVSEEVKTIVKKDIKVQNIKEQNKLNIEILINKESVLQFLIGCVSSELDAFKCLTDREKGEIMLYVFCDNIIESIKKNDYEFNQYIEEYAKYFVFDDKLNIDKKFLSEVMVESIKNCMLEILNEILEKRIKERGF